MRDVKGDEHSIERVCVGDVRCCAYHVELRLDHIQRARNRGECSEAPRGMCLCGEREAVNVANIIHKAIGDVHDDNIGHELITDNLRAKATRQSKSRRRVRRRTNLYTSPIREGVVCNTVAQDGVAEA